MSNKTAEGTNGAESRSTPKNNARRFSLFAFAAILLVGGSSVMIAGMQPSSQASPAPAIKITDSTLAQPTSEPDSTAVPTPSGGTDAALAVPPVTVAVSPSAQQAETPVVPVVSYPASTLNIPSVGISAPIVSGGQNAGGMILPESSKVAEFTGAAALTSPKGSTVIAGHVNFADGSAGALGPLYEVQIGALVYATDAAGTVHEYKVTGSQVLNKQGLPSGLFRTAGSKQLVLVTCGGELEMVNGAWAYTHNQVVTAEPV